MQKYITYMKKVTHQKTELQMLSENMPPSANDYNTVFRELSRFEFDLKSPHVIDAINSLANESPEDL